jgi:hypothetical protein
MPAPNTLASIVIMTIRLIEENDIKGEMRQAELFEGIVATASFVIIDATKLVAYLGSGFGGCK